MADVVRDGQSVDNEDEDIVAPTQQEPDVGNNNLFIEEEIGLGAKDENYVLTLFKMLLALAVVIAIIVFLLRFIGKKSQSYHSSRTLQNIGGVPLGANKSVQLIKVGSHVLVVGVGDSIQLLKEIRDESEVKQIIEQQTLQTDSEQIPFVSRFFGRSKRLDSTK
ncbi:MAG: flagellar biosynthetic protein FliO [Bacillaceae bacterium]|nr:flagellar biosynthetic protein FliO [Bacillaceae bacterium]